MLKRALITVAGIWFLWLLFGAILLGNASGKTGWGGFSIEARGELDRFLNDRGFTPSPSTTGQNEEWFRGSYQGSRPFLVRIRTQDAGPYGIYVETKYDFKGFKRNVQDSSKKAEEFADILHHWSTEQRMVSINARQKASDEPGLTAPAP